MKKFPYLYRNYPLLAFISIFIFLVAFGCAKEIKTSERDPERAREHYTLGMFYGEMGEDTVAVREFLEALRYDPENAEILAELAFVLAKLRRFSEAEEHAEKAIAKGIPDTDLYIILGNGAKDRGETRKAVSYYKKALGDTTNYFLVLNLAQLMRDHNDFDEAITLLGTLKTRFPFDLRIHTQLGDLYGRAEQYDLSIKEFREALLLDSLYYPALLGLGIVFEITAQVDSSLRYYEKAIQLNPSNSSLLKRIVEFEIIKEKWEDAKDHALLILAVSPTEHSVRKQLAYAYYRLDETENALEQYLLLSGLLPKDMGVFHFLGRVYYHRNEFEKAKDALRSSVALNSEFILNYEFLFLISVKEMDENSGKKYFEAMKDRNVPEQSIYFRIGNLLYREDEYELSRPFFLKSIHTDARYAPSWYSLGFVYERLGSIDSSEYAFRKVLEIDSENANTMNALGYMFVEQGIKLDEAQQLIEHALEIDSLNGYYMDSLGWLFFKQGDYLKAKELLQKAALFAEDAVIYDHLGDVFEELGDDEKAHEMWLKALELDPGNEDIIEKINLYIREKTPIE